MSASAPKCPLCGKSEWGHVCGGPGEAKSKPVRAAASLEKSSQDGAEKGWQAKFKELETRVSELEVKLTELTSKQPANRKEYMRNYMRKYRAKACEET